MCSLCMLSGAWVASFASKVASYKATRRLTSVVNEQWDFNKGFALPGLRRLTLFSFVVRRRVPKDRIASTMERSRLCSRSWVVVNLSISVVINNPFLGTGGHTTPPSTYLPTTASPS